MKRLLAFCFLLAWACGCAAQAPTVYVDNLTGTNIIVTGTGCTNTILSCSIATSNGTLYSTWSPGMVFLFGDPQSINLDTTGLVLGPQTIFKTFLYQGTIRLSPADGAFHITPDVHFDNVVYGDGSGLTNIMGTNIMGAVLESSHATNADRVPISGVVTPGPIVTNLNAFPVTLNTNLTVGTNLIVTANTTTSNIRLQAGNANSLVVTNGRVGIGKSTPSEALDVGGGIRSDAYVWAAAGYYLGWVGRAAIYSAGPTDINLRNPADGASTITLSTSNLLARGFVVATNGLYYSATSNGVVSTNVIQPLHTFAAMMGYVTNTINGGANTYAIVTNYSTARTNLMSCSLTAGTITNTIAGYYYCAIHMSMVSLDAGALVEGDLLLNGAVRDEISFQTQFDPGTPRYKGASAFGILYIPANSQITFQIKSSGASGIELRRQQLVVMPP